MPSILPYIVVVGLLAANQSWHPFNVAMLYTGEISEAVQFIENAEPLQVTQDATDAKIVGGIV